jgi:hypothetical protein
MPGVHASDTGVVGATSPTVAVCETLPMVARTVAFWLMLMDAVVTVTDARVEPAATLNEVGTLSIGLVLERLISAPPAGAAWFRDTAQELEVFGPRLLGAQRIEVGTVGATS